MINYEHRKRLWKIYLEIMLLINEEILRSE